MQAELTIDQATAGDDGNGRDPKTPTTPITPAANSVKIGRGRVARNTGIVPVTCALATRCRGLLQLLAGTRAAKAKQPKVYGKARFSIPAHRTKPIKVKLTAAAKKLLKRRRSVRMVARATVGSQVTTSALTLKR